MKTKSINKEYLQIPKEIPLFLKLVLNKKQKPTRKIENILIVNTCLIGEFIASLHSIRDFIKKNKNKVDLIVAPEQKELAEKIIGIRNVYTAKSIYNRNFENYCEENCCFEEYDKVIALRMSKDSYRIAKNLKANETKTALFPFIKYSLHLSKNLLMRKIPKQWREFNFEVLGNKNKILNFEDIFNFNKKDYEKIKRFSEIRTKNKIIIIHTHSNWPMKNWDNEKWIELIKNINKLDKYRFVFIGIKEDEIDYNYISSKLNFKTYSLINKLDLIELMLVLRTSNYFIGIDSGPRNMAHLANLRSITLLGPGPHMYMPTSKKDIIIDKSNGRGLYQMFISKKKGFIDKIEVNEVYNAFKKLIKNKNNLKKDI